MVHHTISRSWHSTEPSSLLLAYPHRTPLAGQRLPFPFSSVPIKSTTTQGAPALVYHSEAHPEQRVVMAVGHLFSLDLAPTKDCLTCRGSGSIYFEDDGLVGCRRCHGTGGNPLPPPPQRHYPPCRGNHRQKGGKSVVSKHDMINIPRVMHGAMPFGPSDFITFTPTDSGLEVVKDDKSCDALTHGWYLHPLPELLKMAGLEYKDRLHMKVFGNVLFVRKVTAPESMPEPESTPAPVPELVIAPILGVHTRTISRQASVE